ncbi:hypothetical protein EDC01DRAFT_162224 [Geopyxis carbonaria]|nr:hypothetical protein EDC01DRAFT_162224 [Geopyxis carbonaria]
MNCRRRCWLAGFMQAAMAAGTVRWGRHANHCHGRCFTPSAVPSQSRQNRLSRTPNPAPACSLPFPRYSLSVRSCHLLHSPPIPYPYPASLGIFPSPRASVAQGWERGEGVARG